MKDAESTLRADDSLSQAADIILPSQYFGAMGRIGLSAEQRLMLAVLIDAINVLQSWRSGGSARKRRDFAEAVHWVNTSGTLHPFAFDSVCNALEIDSALVRSRLRRFTSRPANATCHPAVGHLRLKEVSRARPVTAARLRRRLPRMLPPREKGVAEQLGGTIMVEEYTAAVSKGER